MNISNNFSSLVPSRSIVCREISANKNITADTKRKGARSTRKKPSAQGCQVTDLYKKTMERLGTRLQILEKVAKQKLRLYVLTQFCTGQSHTL